MKKSIEKESLLTASELRGMVSYEGGRFFWLVDKQKPRAMAGMEAGSVSGEYHRVSIDHKKYLTHRLVWLYFYGQWPLDQLDHINGNKLDNRIENLRLAGASQNQSNISVRPSKKSPWPKGVSYESDRRKWRAGIKFCGISFNLGYYDSPELAHEAYALAAKKYFGEFARTS